MIPIEGPKSAFLIPLANDCSDDDRFGSIDQLDYTDCRFCVKVYLTAPAYGLGRSQWLRFPLRPLWEERGNPFFIDRV